MSTVTAADILKVVPITRKTLWLWQKKYQFFPNPTKKVHPGGKGIVGYYPTWVRSRCLNIYELQKKGYTVPMIKEILQKEARDKSSRKILIVDNEKQSASLLERLFTKNNFIVEVAYNGMEAGLKAFDFSPSIIIVDLDLPGLNGIEVCQILKFNPKTKNIDIIAISGNSNCSEKVVLDAGAEIFLKKPINSAQVLDECRGLIEHPEFIELSPTPIS